MQSLLPCFIFSFIVSTSPAVFSAEAIDPPPSKGKITYQGTYSGRQLKISKRNSPEKGLFGAITTELAKLSNHNSSEKELVGAITIELVFDGPAVTAKYSTTGLLPAQRVSGLVNDLNCKLFYRNGGTMEGECSSADFSGVIRSPAGDRNPVEVFFETSVTQIVDYEKRDRKNAEDAANAQHKRAEDAEKAQLQRAKDDAMARAEQEAELARQKDLLRSLPPINSKK